MLAGTLAGDNTVLGWTATAGYFVAAAFCLQAGRRRRARASAGGAMFWFSLAAGLTFLGVNKQLDLQTSLTAIGRRLAIEQGWYDHRQGVQVAAVCAVAALGAAGFLAACWLTLGRWRDFGTALIGVGLLAVFVIIRTAHIERLESIMGAPTAASQGRWVLELGGLACIALSAWRHGRSGDRPAMAASATPLR